MPSLETLEKYNKNEKLSIQNVWELLQDELEYLEETQRLTDFSDEENIKASNKEEGIRFAMDLFQRLEN